MIIAGRAIGAEALLNDTLSDLDAIDLQYRNALRDEKDNRLQAKLAEAEAAQAELRDQVDEAKDAAQAAQSAVAKACK